MLSNLQILDRLLNIRKVKNKLPKFCCGFLLFNLNVELDFLFVIMACGTVSFELPDTIEDEVIILAACSRLNKNVTLFTFKINVKLKKSSSMTME